MEIWWLVLFIDDHTRLMWIFLMKEKIEASQSFRNFNFMMQTQFHTKIQALKIDIPFKTALGNYFLGQGIVHISSCRDTFQQNGDAKKKNQHLLEVARSHMFSTHVPKCLWGEVVLIISYLINKMPSQILEFQTPCQVLLQTFANSKITSSLNPKNIWMFCLCLHTPTIS